MYCFALCPGLKHVAHKLRTIVQDDRLRFTPGLQETLERIYYRFACYGGVNAYSQAFSGKNIQDREAPETS